jgi:hypothetical protein
MPAPASMFTVGVRSGDRLRRRAQRPASCVGARVPVGAGDPGGADGESTRLLLSTYSATPHPRTAPPPSPGWVTMAAPRKFRYPSVVASVVSGRPGSPACTGQVAALLGSGMPTMAVRSDGSGRSRRGRGYGRTSGRVLVQLDDEVEVHGRTHAPRHGEAHPHVHCEVLGAGWAPPVLGLEGPLGSGYPVRVFGLGLLGLGRRGQAGADGAVPRPAGRRYMGILCSGISG